MYSTAPLSKRDRKLEPLRPLRSKLSMSVTEFATLSAPLRTNFNFLTHFSSVLFRLMQYLVELVDQKLMFYQSIQKGLRVQLAYQAPVTLIQLMVLLTIPLQVDLLIQQQVIIC